VPPLPTVKHLLNNDNPDKNQSSISVEDSTDASDYDR
jgi:hypothetical protein